jgi:hypothetical protein
MQYAILDSDNPLLRDRNVPGAYVVVDVDLMKPYRAVAGPFTSMNDALTAVERLRHQEYRRVMALRGE